MKSFNNLSRRKFIQSATALSFFYLPGVGRIKANPFSLEQADDFTGRLCYNENPLGPSPLSITAMNKATAQANRYPDWYSSNLEEIIASHHGLARNNICVGAGATEVIRLIADAFLGPGEEMITATPTYFQMASEAITNGASVVYVPVDENYTIDLGLISEAITDNTKLISLVNPNNPLATIINKSEMESFLNSLPRAVITIIDEAYHHYVHSPEYESCIRFIDDGLPVIVVRTFSKVYGLAGARIGYSVASSSYTNQISASQMFGTVSNLGHAAAEAALTDETHLANSISLNDEAKDILRSGLSKLRLDYIDSTTNFMMFDTGTNAENIATQLDAHGYQVRFGWGMPSHLRVSTGLLDEMSGFIDALGQIMGIGGMSEITPPTMFGLNSIYPNPFNSRCEIKITTVGSEKTSLSIYDVNGRKIRSLLNQSVHPGEHKIIWDGKDVAGKMVASGVYIMNLIQGEHAVSSRATLVK
jgi:histidinol-phosphate aminotransferase